MCVLCYELAPEEHWSDAAGDDPNLSGWSARHRRTKLIAAVLAPYGLIVSDPGIGPHRMIGDRKGSGEVVAGLPATWRTADRLSPRPLDVLDPALLDTLASGSG